MPNLAVLSVVLGRRGKLPAFLDLSGPTVQGDYRRVVSGLAGSFGRFDAGVELLPEPVGDAVAWAREAHVRLLSPVVSGLGVGGPLVVARRAVGSGVDLGGLVVRCGRDVVRGVASGVAVRDVAGARRRAAVLAAVLALKRGE